MSSTGSFPSKLVINRCGEVQKILIFEKSKLWKAFVELESVQSAQNALESLNNTQIFMDGSIMNVYSSNLQTIKF